MAKISQTPMSPLLRENIVAALLISQEVMEDKIMALCQASPLIMENMDLVLISLLIRNTMNLAQDPV